MNQTMTEQNVVIREHFDRASRTGQEAISSAVRTWGETMQSMWGMKAGSGQTPTPEHLVDRWFDTAEEVLDAQREFVEGLLNIGKPALQAMARVAQQTSDVIQQSSHEVDKDAPQPSKSPQP